MRCNIHVCLFIVSVVFIEQWIGILGWIFFSVNQVNELHLSAVKRFDPLQISVHEDNFPSNTYILWQLWTVHHFFFVFYFGFYLISSD